VGTGVIVANELLDNLAFGLVEAHQGRWHEVRIEVAAGGGFAEVRGDAVDDPGWPAAPDGARLPRQDAAAAFVRDALARLTHGSLLVLDYAALEADLAARPWRDWVRTYRDHERGGHPLDDPGTQDVTCEVALDALARVAPPTEQGTQADFLRAHGIEVLVDEGRRAWREGAAAGGLAALQARSRVREADALLDPGGLGGFTALRWVR
jgi:SAM-dependent MidA family methyltransferase